MNFFVCLVRSSGDPVTAADRQMMAAHLLSRGIDGVDWEGSGSFYAVVRRTGEHGPALARAGGVVGMGHVRLDNPEEVARLLPEAPAPARHLELALRATEALGAAAADRIVGDFAYVAWNAAARRLLAVRDPFGVRPLFYRQFGADLLAFSSHASLLGTSGVNRDYIAKYFLRSLDDRDAIFDSVQVVPAGHTLEVVDGRWSLQQYWSTDRFDTDLKLTGPAAVEQFRALFADAVRLRMEARGPVWSELSGGLDTSSIVSMSDWLHRSGHAGKGLAGTINFAESMGSGDESEYVDAVLGSTGLPVERYRECWPWKDDGGAPLRTELPGPVTMFWARERWRSEVLRDAGAQVLLSGFGGDHVLEGNIYFFADWVRAGAFGRAFGELARWAALGQSSFWKLAYTHALVPLLPTAVQSRLKVGSKPRIPAWVTRDSRDGMEEHANRVRRARPVGGALPWYGRHSAFLVQCFSRGIPRTDPFITYERRYPFLYRPLVEFTLQLPPEMKIRPGERKVALREAMRGVLPERVRTRLGEGGIGSRMLWSLNHERRRIESMLRDPMLAQMGFVDAESLRKAYHTARTGTSQLTVPLFSTLALESWLLIESGRWTLRDGNTTPLIYKEKSHGEHEAAVPGAGAR